jgi:hypothetical protein
MLPLLTAAWLAPVEFHRELGRMAKYMDFGLYTLALAGVFSFAFGAFLAAHTRPASSALAVTQAATSPAVCRLLEVVTWVLFGVAVAAYAIWFMPLFRDPSILLDVFAGRWSERDIRNTIGTIPGVTTLVQAQIPYVTLLALAGSTSRRPVRRGWKSWHWWVSSCLRCCATSSGANASP